MCLGAFWCGFFGVICSLTSYTDHKNAEYDRASYKKKWAWCCSIFGVLISLAWITVVVVLIIVLWDDTKDYLCDHVSSSYDFC